MPSMSASERIKQLQQENDIEAAKTEEAERITKQDRELQEKLKLEAREKAYRLRLQEENQILDKAGARKQLEDINQNLLNGNGQVRLTANYFNGSNLSLTWKAENDGSNSIFVLARAIDTPLGPRGMFISGKKKVELKETDWANKDLVEDEIAKAFLDPYYEAPLVPFERVQQ